VGLRILWGTLLALWLILVIMGKGGFIHLLLLNGISVLMIDLVARYRAGKFRKQRGSEI
jgi:hypothetical protein